ncbi:MAG: hypothetical protein V3S37_02770 [Dehalococcoidia bacterium]
MNSLEINYERRELRGRDRTGRFLSGPPLPAWWPAPLKRISLDGIPRHHAGEPRRNKGLGPAKLALQIVTRWD